MRSKSFSASSQYSFMAIPVGSKYCLRILFFRETSMLMAYPISSSRPSNNIFPRKDVINTKMGFSIGGDIVSWGIFCNVWRYYWLSGCFWQPVSRSQGRGSTFCNMHDSLHCWMIWPSVLLKLRNQDMGWHSHLLKPETTQDLVERHAKILKTLTFRFYFTDKIKPSRPSRT